MIRGSKTWLKFDLTTDRSKRLIAKFRLTSFRNRGVRGLGKYLPVISSKNSKKKKYGKAGSVPKSHNGSPTLLVQTYRNAGTRSLFLILFLSVNFQNTIATIDLNQTFSEERALGKIISDVQGDVTNGGFPELDLLGAWMGDDDQHLFFTVKYDFVSNDFSFVNVRSLTSHACK